MRLSAPLALSDLDEQVRQRDVRAVNGNQRPLGVLPLPAALIAREAHRVARVVAEFEGACHAVATAPLSPSLSGQFAQQVFRYSLRGMTAGLRRLASVQRSDVYPAIDELE
ncbi:MAG: hypothetical protein WBM06_02930 [Pseudolabrys sp.]